MGYESEPTILSLLQYSTFDKPNMSNNCNLIPAISDAGNCILPVELLFTEAHVVSDESAREMIW